MISVCNHIRQFTSYACYLLFLTCFSCKEKYDVLLNTPPTGYLVVEGIINANGTTTIRISRTSQLSEKQLIPERSAVVAVQGSNDTHHSLAETADGVYAADLALDTTLDFRLHIFAQGKEYVSAFEAVKSTPLIDSVSWSRQNGLDIDVSSHDPSNKTIFYKWEFQETWEITSAYESNLVFNLINNNPDKKIEVAYYNPVNQQFNQNIITCWQGDRSTAIHIGSSEKLSQDIISAHLLNIPEGSVKIGKLYSLNVVQYALSREAFEFYSKLKKNTEILGSIFDTQPSEIKGNLTCLSDLSEIVIGHVGVATIQQKRIFIKPEQVNWRYDDGCADERIIPNLQDSVWTAYGNGLYPTQAQQISPDGSLISFKAATAVCVDCTLSGTNVKPAFWP